MPSLLIIAKFQKINNYKFMHNNLRDSRLNIRLSTAVFHFPLQLAAANLVHDGIERITLDRL